MISYRDSILIHAPVAAVYSYINDLSTMPEWLTGLVEVRNLVGDGEGQQCEWTFKLAGIPLHGEAVIIECVTDRKSVHQTIGMIGATWTSLVEPHEGGTKLSIDVEYSLPGAVLGRLAEHLTVRRMSGDLHASLLNAKDLLEG